MNPDTVHTFIVETVAGDVERQHRLRDLGVATVGEARIEVARRIQRELGATHPPIVWWFCPSIGRCFGRP